MTGFPPNQGLSFNHLIRSLEMYQLQLQYQQAMLQSGSNAIPNLLVDYRLGTTLSLSQDKCLLQPLTAPKMVQNSLLSSIIEEETGGAIDRVENKKSRYCTQKGCRSFSQGGTKKCVRHGGGRRCAKLGCKSGARGSTRYCIRHGGGTRCRMKGCPKSAVGSTKYCVNHGGGRRCNNSTCSKSAQGATNFCVVHGRNRKCMFDSCGNFALTRKNYCIEHQHESKKKRRRLIK